LIYQAKGLLQEAVAEFRRAGAISSDDPWSVMYLGNVLALLGKPAGARAALRELERLDQRRHVSPFFFGVLHYALGEKDHAFDLFDKAIDDRDDSITWTHSSPAFDTLRTDPRYDLLLKRINFPAD